eukprot:m.28537 g.28537  ORF g.28537 m.28537 type:complete len:763 (+) comp30827_c0_seq3:388-2676(+)
MAEKLVTISRGGGSGGGEAKLKRAAGRKRTNDVADGDPKKRSRIVQNFPSFPSVDEHEIRPHTITSSHFAMLKKPGESTAMDLKRKRASAKEKKAAKRRRSDGKDGGTRSSDDDGCRKVVHLSRKKITKKTAAAANNECTTSPISDRGYLCDSESEGDVKRLEICQRDRYPSPKRTLHLGKGDLNDLFKVAAKERSNLQRQSAAAAAAGGGASQSSPSVTKPSLATAVGPIGPPSKAPSGQQMNSSREWAEKARAGHSHAPAHPERLTPDAKAVQPRSHFGAIPTQHLLDQQQKGLLQASVQHQHQHHHEHQHLHQHQHQFSLAPPTLTYGPEHLHQFPVPYGAGSQTMANNGVSEGVGVAVSGAVIGSGSSAFQPKKPGKWCSAHGRIAWTIYNVMKAQKEMQAKAEASAAALLSSGVVHHDAVFQGRGGPVGMPVGPAGHPLFGLDAGARGGLAMPQAHPISGGLMPNFGPEGSHLGLRMGPHHPSGFGPADRGSPWGGPSLREPSTAVASVVSKGDDKEKKSSEGEEKSRRHSETGQSSPRDIESFHPMAGHPLNGVKYGKGGSSAFNNVGSGPSIGSGLGIGAFLGHPQQPVPTSLVNTSMPSGKPSVSSASSPPSSGKADLNKQDVDRKSSKKASESPRRVGQRESPLSVTSPQQHHHHHHHVAPPPALMGASLPVAFGYHPSVASYSSQSGHMLGMPTGPFVGFPHMAHGPGGMMSFPPGPPFGMMNFHPGLTSHKVVAFDEKAASPVAGMSTGKS